MCASGFRRLLSTAGVLLTLPFAAGILHAGAAVMIWPIDPIIRGNERATSLWLENHGAERLTMQVRVVAWTEEDFADRYAESQAAVIASPPLITVDPGKRQLVRVTRTAQVPAGRELAYRILIDQLPSFEPAAAPPPSTGNAAMSVAVRIRYSLPLFLYGPGLAPAKDETPQGRSARADLRWKIESEQGLSYLYVRNIGTGHARLTDVGFVSRDKRVELTSGLLGYVLPGATMRWPLQTAAPTSPVVLEARALANRNIAPLLPF